MSFFLFCLLNLFNIGYDNSYRKSLKKMLNKIGPNIDTWGTPDKINRNVQ